MHYDSEKRINWDIFVRIIPYSPHTLSTCTYLWVICWQMDFLKHHTQQSMQQFPTTTILFRPLEHLCEEVACLLHICVDFHCPVSMSRCLGNPIVHICEEQTLLSDLFANMLLLSWQSLVLWKRTINHTRTFDIIILPEKCTFALMHKCAMKLNLNILNFYYNFVLKGLGPTSLCQKLIGIF